MSDFEFVSIILSIVVGLGITRILTGLAATIRHRATLSVDALSVLWASTVLLWQILFWLGTVNSYRTQGILFTLGNFGTLLLSAVALYFAAALILPTAIQPATDLGQHFWTVRKPFFLVLVTLPLLEFLDSAQHGMDNLVALGAIYLAVQAASAVGCVIGYSTENRHVHGALVWAFFIGAFVWLLTNMWVI
jgi:hypothetical protein